MDFSKLQPNIVDLQEDAIDLLKQTDELIDRASRELGYVADKETDRQELTVYKKSEISTNIKNLENLELRMAVVATAKSGKSTFINAISGQDILPSRQTPMTALPTEIVFNSEQKTPILVLDKDILLTLTEIVSLIDKELKVDKQLQNVEQLNELEDLINRIKSNILTFNEKVEGAAAINRALTDLNDTIRLCQTLKLSLDYRLFEKITTIPRIETSFCQGIRIQKNENTHSKDYKSWKGKLVIVDTPGSNEFIEENNTELWLSVCAELEKSSIILFIIDSNQLQTDASEKFRKEVQKIISISGTKDFYVLVNKIDQNIRERDKLTPEQLRKKVAIKFGVLENHIINKVFTISGIWAFTAILFLGNMHDLSDDQIVDNWIESQKLAVEIWPTDWEDNLPKKTKGDLQPKAENLLKKSGFEEFINRVLKILMEESAPRIISSVLRRTNSSLNNLSSQIKLQDSIKNLNTKSEEIENEIERLKSYLSQLEQTRNNGSQLQISIEKLKNNFDKEITKKIQEIQDILINKLKKQEEALEFTISIIQEHRNRSSFSEIEDILKKSSPSSLESKFIVSLIESINTKDTKINGNNLITCNSKKIADELSTYLDLEIKGILKGELLNKKDIEQPFENIHISLNKLLNEITNTIIDEARTRLEKVFNVRITIPDLSQELENFKSEVSTKETKVKGNIFNIVKEFSQKVLKTLKLIFIKDNEEKNNEKKPVNEKSKLYYFDIKEGYLQTSAIRQMCNSFKDLCINNVNEELQKHVNDFYNEINECLKSYQISLQVAKSHKDDHGLIKQNYEYFEKEVKNLIVKIEKRLDFADLLIKK